MENSGNVRRRRLSSLARCFGVFAVTCVCIFLPSPTLADSSQANAFPAIHGQAVDDLTNGRLAGVSIIAFWAGPDATPLQYSQTLRVLDIKSDAHGFFMVPASERMGPKSR